MELLLGAMVLALLFTKTISEAKTDQELARKGVISPRLQARHGGREQAAAKVAKYGFLDHLRDSWRDHWARRTDATIAARNARAADGRSRPRWRDRVKAAGAAIAAPWKPDADDKPADPVVALPPSAPVAPAPAADPDPFAMPPPDPDPFTPLPPPAASAEPAEPPDPAPGPAPAPAPPPTNPEPTPEPAPTATPGGTMSTGEVTNYETALAELDEQIAEVTEQLDAAQGAVSALATAEAAVDAMQQSYEGTAAAVATTLDHEAALNLDGTTLAHTGAAVDAMPAGAVNSLYEATEAAKAMAQERVAGAEATLAELQAKREHLIATYADAADTVATNLGGDSTFVGSGGGGTTANGSQPGPSIYPQPGDFHDPQVRGRDPQVRGGSEHLAAQGSHN